MKHAAIWAVLCCLASAVASAEQFQDRLSIYNERHLCSVGPPSRCNQELAARAVSVSAYLVTGTSSSLSSFSTPSKTLDAVKWNTPVSPALFPVSTAAAAESPKITMAIPRSLHLPAQVMAESSTWANKSLSGWSYVGCFGPKSSHSRRNSTASWNYNSVNSLDKCAERCSNSQYYGVANRFDCQCGDSIDDKSIIKAPESNCNLTCAWPHNNQFCGGNSYMGVYRNAQGSSKNRTFGMTVNSTMSSTHKRSATETITVSTPAALANFEEEMSKFDESVVEAIESLVTAAFGTYPLETPSSSVSHFSSSVAVSALRLKWFPKASGRPGTLHVPSARPTQNHSNLRSGKVNGWPITPTDPIRSYPYDHGTTVVENNGANEWLNLAGNGTRKSTAAENAPSFTRNVIGFGLVIFALALFY